MSPMEIAVEFQKRRKKWILITIPCATVFVFLFITMKDFEGSNQGIAVVTIILSLMIWTMSTVAVYNCPKCGTTPFTARGHGGIILNPDECIQCKSILKPENL